MLYGITHVNQSRFWRSKIWRNDLHKNKKTSKNEEELSIFYTKDILNDDWIAHPKNPIISGKKGSRSAGKIFEDNGKILRPAQDGRKRYGYGMIFYEILTLNENEYKEKVDHEIYPNWDKNIIGTHTYVKENKLTIMDLRIKKYKILESILNKSEWIFKIEHILNCHLIKK